MKLIALFFILFLSLPKSHAKELKNEIDLQINSRLITTQGIFFDGQIFDAYEFATKLVRSAGKSIILIDNYIDETTISILSQKEKSLCSNSQTPRLYKKHQNSAFCHSERSEESSLYASFWILQSLRSFRMTSFAMRKPKQLKTDIDKANKQYGNFTLKQFTKSHDRFLIIDDEVYHLGASLKDLGKKWFAFSKLDKNSVESMMESIKKHH